MSLTDTVKNNFLENKRPDQQLKEGDVAIVNFRHTIRKELCGTKVTIKSVCCGHKPTMYICTARILGGKEVALYANEMSKFIKVS